MFSKNVKYLRKRRKWTQKEVADRLGYKSGVAIYKWEIGENRPPFKMISVVADLFGVSEQDLMNTDIEKRDLEMLSGIDNISVPAAHAVPMLGTICAGAGIDCEDNYDGVFFVDNSIKADLCVTVKGNSMIDAGIKNNDKAFIKRNCSYDNGKIYAVRIHEETEAVLKRVYWQDKSVILCPCNDQFEPVAMSEEDVSIIGECVGVYHGMV